MKRRIREVGNFMRAQQVLLSVATAVAATCLLVGSLAAEDWKKYSYRENGFEVEFPDTPKTIETPLNEPMKSQIVRSTNYVYDFDQNNYAVGATLLNAIEFNFDAGAKGTFDTFQCKTTVSDRTLQIFNARGRELIGSACSGVFRFESRYFLKGRWFYQVFARYKENGGDTSTARHFLSSFKIY